MKIRAAGVQIGCLAVSYCDATGDPGGLCKFAPVSQYRRFHRRRSAVAGAVRALKEEVECAYGRRGRAPGFGLGDLGDRFPAEFEPRRTLKGFRREEVMRVRGAETGGLDL